MSLSGGVIPWIINLFKSPLSSLIKNEIHKQFCELTRTVLLTEANNALLTLPTHVEITNNIYMDYGLIHNPIITKDYVQGDALIDITVGNKTCNIPFKPVKLCKFILIMHGLEFNIIILTVGPEMNDYMVNIWFSESVIDCLLASAHEEQMLKFVIDKNLQKNLTQFLRTS